MIMIYNHFITVITIIIVVIYIQINLYIMYGVDDVLCYIY